MRIRNLAESSSFRQIWAESLAEFRGGTTQSVGSVTARDIATLTGRLIDQVYAQKLDVVGKNH